jgi:competence protein ComEC
MFQKNKHSEFIELVHGIPCEIQGRVIAVSRLEQSRMKQSILIESSTITLLGLLKDTRVVSRKIQVYTLRPYDIIADDHISIKGVVLKKPNKDSYNFYLMKENIAATAFLINEKLELMHRPKQSFFRWLSVLKDTLLKECRKKLNKQTFSLFSSVFLGNRLLGKKEMEDPKEQCKTWGISHYLARSGLHLVIFVFAWHMLLKLLPIPFLLKELIMLFLSILYFLLSWTSISFIRAFATFIFYKTCIITSSPINTFYLLTLVCFLVLLFNPMQLFFLDFQLSFGLTFALAWFNNVQVHKKLQTNSNH